MKCSVVGYQRFGRTFCLHIQGEVNDDGRKDVKIVDVDTLKVKDRVFPVLN
jgi:hypothetical protein